MKIENKLNPVIEILGLINESKNEYSYKDTIIKELEKRNVNGTLFYKKHLKLVDNYISVFKENMVPDKNNSLYLCTSRTCNDVDSNNEFSIFIFIVKFINVIYDKVKNSESLSDDDIRKIFFENYIDEDEHEDNGKLNSPIDFVSFLNNEDISDSAKWYFMRLLNNPSEMIKSITKLIDDNLYAYEKAYKSVEVQSMKLIDKMQSDLISPKCIFTNDIIGIDGISRIVPSLFFSVSYVGLDDEFIYGLYCETYLKEHDKSMGNKTDMILKFKALSDKSKLEIVELLSKKSMYASEIAEKLNLTSATVSYHMNVLMEAGFITIKKKDGRIYYYFKKDSMQNLVDNMNQTLL